MYSPIGGRIVADSFANLEPYLGSPGGWAGSSSNSLPLRPELGSQAGSDHYSHERVQTDGDVLDDSDRTSDLWLA